MVNDIDWTDGRTDGWTDGRTNEVTDVLMETLTVVEQNSPRCDAAFCLCPIKITPGLYGLK